MTDPKIVLVTGGARRVGRAVVERFFDADFKVLFTYNNGRAAAEELIAKLNRQRPDSVFGFQLDLATPDASDRLANIIRLSAHNKLDVLVNNASLFEPDDGPHGPSIALQRRLFDINAFAPASITTALSQPLLAAKGCVVNFVDLLAEKPWPAYSAYCASKAALHASTLAFARKLAPHVRVNGVAPGVIDWPESMPIVDREAYLKRVPLARAGTPKDAAEMVYWLATAAPYITGEIIKLDGGRSLT